MNNTKLIAHRGLSGTYLENTKPAFVLAGKNKYVNAIECDIRFSLDNKIIIFHDKSLKRLNGSKEYISRTPYFLLKTYKLFDKRDGVFDKGYSICKFTSYLKICKRYKKTAVIEIKEGKVDQLDFLISVVKKSKILSNVIFISTHQKILLYLRKRLPYVKLQLIVKNPIKSKFMFCLKNKINLSIYYKFLKTETVENFHKFGLEVSVWTVNDIQLIKKLVAINVDYITSNYAFDLNGLK